MWRLALCLRCLACLACLPAPPPEVPEQQKADLLVLIACRCKTTKPRKRGLSKITTIREWNMSYVEYIQKFHIANIFRKLQVWRWTCTDCTCSDTAHSFFLHKAETTSSHGVSRRGWAAKAAHRCRAPGAAPQAPSAPRKESRTVEKAGFSRSLLNTIFPPSNSPLGWAGG